ncbi:MAG: hypothetical protein ABIH11_09045 [Candidatus Altiarchaeota archaeon]
MGYGQLSTEYLVVLAVVVITGVIVVSIISDFLASPAQDIMGSRSYWTSSEIGILNWAITADGEVQLSVRNNAGEDVTITELMVDGENILPQPILLKFGEKKKVSGSITGGTGTYSKPVEVSYEYGAGGVSKTFSGERPIVGEYMSPGQAATTTLSGQTTTTVVVQTTTTLVVPTTTTILPQATTTLPDPTTTTQTPMTTTSTTLFGQTTTTSTSSTTTSSTTTTTTLSCTPMNGDGSASSPWEVTDCCQLQLVRREYYPTSQHYLMTNDIDCLAYPGFQPLNGPRSTDVFDGGGHKITGLSIISTRQYVGLFMINSGVIKNLGLKDVEIGCPSGNQYAGPITADNFIGGTIENCYATGSIKSSGQYVGELVGDSRGDIRYSYADVKITGSGQYRGGLVGDVRGSVTSSFAAGSLPTPFNVCWGGLVGYVRGTITNSYYYNNHGECCDCGSCSDCSKASAVSDFYSSSHPVYSGWSSSVWKWPGGGYPCFVNEDGC